MEMSAGNNTTAPVIIDISKTGLKQAKNYYRNFIKNRGNYTWHVCYKYSDIFISSDIDIRNKIEKPLKNIYQQLEYCAVKDPVFLKSLYPVDIKSYYPDAIKKLCRLSAKFNVGPMAAVAGIVNDFLSQSLSGCCSNLIIENGGDIFLKTTRDLNVGIYIKNPYFKDRLSLKINPSDTPCSVCASSGTFGHSFSMGSCDLAVIISKSAVSADAAATAAANSVRNEADIEKSIEYFKEFSSVQGIMLIKNKKIGLWGKVQL